MIAWGIDWATGGASLGVDRAGELAWRSVSWPAGPKCAGARRLAGARKRLVAFLGDAAWDLGDPNVVVVEQPFGRVAPESLQMFGVVLCAVAESVGCPVVTLGPGQWKLRATGHGGHRKPKRGEDFEYGVLTWARALGYSGADHNEADAIGCARAGSLLLERDLRTSSG